MRFVQIALIDTPNKSAGQLEKDYLLSALRYETS